MNICLITALPFEAKNLIKMLNLQQVKFLLPLYQKDNITLCITGAGKIKMQKAMKLLTKTISAPTWWINFGIAGSKNQNLGDVFAIDKIINKPYDTKLPHIISDLPAYNLITTDKPTTIYQRDDVIYDMEALYFYQAISNNNQNQKDIISIFKIISDNEKNPIQTLNKNKALGLIKKSAQKIVTIIETFA
ncbi:MAG: hypothetical protein DRQ51_06015 [Gammaproteobacteria bacterium]|nr:MAG: hypothetical protein DRQ51_06015 [Gammaproteobacteria bacterium]